MFRLIYLLIFSGIVIDLAAQSLPRGFAPGEKEQMPHYLNNVIKAAGQREGRSLDEPVRSMAEWEQLDGLIISWDNNFREIQAEIVRNTIPQCKIIIACTSPTTVKNFLSTKGIADSINVQYVTATYNSIWVRDYGPNSVYKNDVDSLYFIDWIYNRPRYQDDSLARQLSRSTGIPLVETNQAPLDLVHTGGNYMSDGLGTAFSSLLVMDENGPENEFGFSNHSEAEVDSIMGIYMGTKVYPKMQTLPYDAIHHIDMHMKILDEQNILVGKYANDVADGAQINANVDYILSNYKNSFGKPYQIHYMPMPPGPNGKYPNQNGDYRTYTNSVFVNKTLIVPFYDVKYDTTAQRIYEELLPGYTIAGINCNKIIPSLGAIHCITKEVGTSDPLMIAVDGVLPIIDSKVEEERIVRAIVKNRSGIDKVYMYYQLDEASAPFDSVEMFLEAVETSTYVATIPEFSKWARYYIKGSAISGKTITRPMTAPEGYFATRTNFVSSNKSVYPDDHIEVYPNPASSVTCVNIIHRNTDNLDVTLYDAAGNLIKKLHSGNWDPNTPRLFFDASKMVGGVYFVRLLSKNGFSIVPVVIAG